MKKLAICFSLAALSSLGAVAHAASTGTITFNGELTDSTCEVTVNGQGADATVGLPPVSINTLTTPGQTTGDTGFALALTDCVVGTAGGQSKVSAFFQAGATVDLGTGRLLNTDASGATMVDLQLVDVQNGNNVINIGDSSQVNDAGYVDIDVDGNANLNYIVRYYANAQTTPGNVTSSVVYNLQYQ